MTTPTKFDVPADNSQQSLPGIASIPEKGKVWPDLSMYQLYFGLARLANGEQKLVMADPEGQWSEYARKWGFRQSRWAGLYFKDSTTFKIPEIQTLFPEAKAMFLTDAEIREHAQKLIVNQLTLRLSQLQERQHEKRHSWHPNKTATRAGRSRRPTAPAPMINAEVALRQMVYCGLNHAGAEVHESGEGLRYIKRGDAEFQVEIDGTSSPDFLRINRADVDGSIRLCATGLVREITSGRHLKSEDFERYVKAIFGDDMLDNIGTLELFNEAIDHAIHDSLINTFRPTREKFEHALTLHEGRPSYYRGGQEFILPCPLAVAISCVITATLPLAKEAKAVAVGVEASSIHHEGELRQIAPGESVGPHHISIASLTDNSATDETVSGVRLYSADQVEILKLLSTRAPEGASAFVLSCSNPGKVESGMRRLIGHLGEHYHLMGLFDIDATMLGVGQEGAKRVLVVGKSLQEPDASFSVPANVDVHYDYSTIWKWIERSTTLDAGQQFALTSDGRLQNKWQAPYIPASQVSEPEAMSPRNLLGPARKALARIKRESGLSIDEYVAEKMQWTQGELAQFLSSEQVDAVAVALHAGGRFAPVEGDATGSGKGRVLACRMRYAALTGQPVLFLTDTDDLFRDIYRDLSAIGSAHLFSNPLIINSDIKLYGEDGMFIGESPSKDQLRSILASDEPPPAALTLATYSQFNTKIDERASRARARAGSDCMRLINEGASRSDVLERLDEYRRLEKMPSLGLTLPLLQPHLDDNDRCIALLRTTLSATATTSLPPGFSARGLVMQLRLRELDEAALKSVFMDSQVGEDLRTQKLLWLRSGAFRDGLLVLDESHVAAGSTSNTHENVVRAINDAKEVMFSSATFAKDSNEFTLYARTFPKSVSPAQISDTLSRGGTPLQEILSAMLVADGRMIRREQDLSMVDFRMCLDVHRTERNESWANSLAEILAAMAVISGEIEDFVAADRQARLAQRKAEAAALGISLAEYNRKKLPSSGLEYTNFSSKYYRLNRAVMLSMIADHVADLAIEDLKENRKPIISVETTNEAILREIINDVTAPSSSGMFESEDSEDDPDQQSRVDLAGASIEGVGVVLDAPLDFRELLRKYADSFYFGFEFEEKIENGKVKKYKTRKSFRHPSMANQFAKIYKLIDAFPAIPISPLDYVKEKVQAAGFTIDEVSGRSCRLGRTPEGKDVIAPLPTVEKSILYDRFNSGALDALIITRRGAVGCSLHASETFADQRQRVLIEMQAPASVKTRIQTWGRVNRRGQVNQPMVRLPMTGLPGEVRLQFMQVNSLRKLSANVSGNADNAALADDCPDLLNKVGNEVCLRWIENHPETAQLLGIRLTEKDLADSTFEKYRNSGTKFVDLVTGRVLMLSVPQQRETYNNISEEFKNRMLEYAAEGRNPLKADEYDFRAKRGESMILEVPPTNEDSVFDEPVRATELHFRRTLAAIPRESLRSEMRESIKGLEERYGDKNWYKHAMEEIANQVQAMAPSLLSKKFASVDAALAKDAPPNDVKNLYARAEHLESRLQQVAPGNYIKWGKSEAEGLVVGLDVPKTAKKAVSLSEYRVKLRSIDERTLKVIPLSAMTDIDVLMGAHSSSQRHARLFEAFEKAEEIDDTRVILEGNLFLAAKIAETRRIGSAVTYTDEQGVWHHAILLPNWMTLDLVKDMTIEVTDGKMLRQYFEENSRGTVADRIPMATWKVHRFENRLQITTSGAKEDLAWLEKCQDIQALLDQEFGNSNTDRSASVSIHRIADFCDALAATARKHGKTMLIAGSHRDWAHQYAARQREIEPADVLSAAIAAKSDTEIDLDALLSDCAM